MPTKTETQLDASVSIGKSKTALNALKHGVFSQTWIDANEQQQFDDLCTALQDEYTVSSPTILIQIERMVMTMVKIRRLQKVENALYRRAQVTAAEHAQEKIKLGLAQSTDSKEEQHVDLALQVAEDSALPDLMRLDTLARYQVSLDRQLSKIIGEIQDLQAAKVKPIEPIEL